MGACRSFTRRWSAAAFLKPVGCVEQLLPPEASPGQGMGENHARHERDQGGDAGDPEGEGEGAEIHRPVPTRAVPVPSPSSGLRRPCWPSRPPPARPDRRGPDPPPLSEDDRAHPFPHPPRNRPLLNSLSNTVPWPSGMGKRAYGCRFPWSDTLGCELRPFTFVRVTLEIVGMRKRLKERPF